MERLEEVIELLKKETEKNCYKIEIVKGTPSILDDKLGGWPYLPVGEIYPKDKNGRALSLLLQINLKNIDLPNFPKKGIFEVFTNNDWPCKYSIKLFEEGKEYQTEFPELDYEFPFISKPLKIVLNKDKAYMSLNDYRIDSVLCPIIQKVYGIKVKSLLDFLDTFEDDNGGDWYEGLNQSLNHHKMTLGGYPDFTQSDPRESMRIKKDECLFKIDSGIERTKSIQIGDSGIIFGLISATDLENINLKKALVDWDCC